MSLLAFTSRSKSAISSDSAGCRFASVSVTRPGCPAKLHKKGEPYSNYNIPKKNNKTDSKIFDFYDSIFIDRPFGENIEVIKDKIIVLPQNYNFDVKGLQILRAGVILGEIVKNRIEPHHSAFTAAKKEN